MFPWACVQVIQAWHDPLAGEIETRAVKGRGCASTATIRSLWTTIWPGRSSGIDIDDLGVFEQQLEGWRGDEENQGGV